MRADTYTFKADDGRELFVYRFLPDGESPPRAVIHVTHGMGEHAARYARAAEALTAAGYAVHAHDHRGHGRTAASSSELGFVADEGGFTRMVGDLDQLIDDER